MVLKMYGALPSTAARATLQTLKALGVEYELIEVDIMAGDQMKPEYLKLNPLHTVPTIDDDGFVIWDSHAINAYLVDKYGKDDSLYPKDLQKRAVVNTRLFFEIGTLVPAYGVVAAPLRHGVTKITNQAASALIEAYGKLETLIGEGPYVAGDSLTIADFSLIATITSANVLVPVASNRFPKIAEWMSKMQALPYYAEANQKGLDKFTEVMKAILAGQFKVPAH